MLARCSLNKKRSGLKEFKFTKEPPNGHKFSFADTFFNIDQDLPLIALTPPLCSIVRPSKFINILNLEKRRYRSYRAKTYHYFSKSKIKIQSLHDLLVKARSNNGLLSKERIIGNIFILHFAGHESNAHALRFALLNLACRPQV